MPPPSNSSAGLLQGLNAVFLIGPTAAGKSRLALALAERADAEIVSLDSMQVYRGMDIGTAKPSVAERARVRHHMLDLVEPDERYDVARYCADLAPVVADLRVRAARALFVGGTGFYLKALLHGIYDGPAADFALRARVEARVRERGNLEAHRELASSDPNSAARIHAHDTRRLVRALEVLEQTGRPLSEWQRDSGWHDAARRPEISRPAAILGLDASIEEIDRRIDARARAMIAGGLAAEAASIRERTGFGPTSAQALGYAEALELVDGTLDAETCAERIARRTRRFARRQRTWYRKVEGVRWLDASRGLEGLLELSGEVFRR